MAAMPPVAAAGEFSNRFLGIMMAREGAREGAREVGDPGVLVI